MWRGIEERGGRGSPASFGPTYGESTEAPGAGRKNMGPATVALDCTMFEQ